MRLARTHMALFSEEPVIKKISKLNRFRALEELVVFLHKIVYAVGKKSISRNKPSIMDF